MYTTQKYLMNQYRIILSSGSILWLDTKKAIKYSKDSGYDGLEILPTRKVVRNIEDAIKLYGEDEWINFFSDLDYIKGIHQNWRLDIGLDKDYKINFLWSMFFTVIRLIFFPNVNKSKKIVGMLSKKLNLPVVTHDTSRKWTYDNNEFSGGIFLELLNIKKENPEEIKRWLTNKQHKIVVDTRDDQSLLWAKNHRLKDWKSFWMQIGLENIGGVQLTLIGKEGLQKILMHKMSMAEEQFLWLNQQKWGGIVTVEVNPLMLIVFNKGKIKQGLQTIADFIRKTLGEGKKWSN